MIRPVLEYACQVWHPGLTAAHRKQLESIQKRALSMIYPDSSYETALTVLDMNTLDTRRHELCVKLFKNMKHPSNKLNNLLPKPVDSGYNTRNSDKLPVPRCKTQRYKNSFVPYALKFCQWPVCTLTVFHFIILTVCQTLYVLFSFMLSTVNKLLSYLLNF